MKDKKEKTKKDYLPLITGLLFGTVGIGAIATGSVLLAQKEDPKPTPSPTPAPTYVTITFDANGGQIDGEIQNVSVGTSFDQVIKPRIIMGPTNQVIDKDKPWVLDPATKEVPKQITGNTIVYANWVDATKSKLTFGSTDSGVHFVGETEVFVDGDVPFGQINKPEATKDDVGTTKYVLSGWAKKGPSGEDIIIQNTDTFPTDTPIHPVFVESTDIEFITLNFSKLESEPDDATITFNGVQDTFPIKMDSKLKWSEINKPVATKTSQMTIQEEELTIEFPFLKWQMKNGSGQLIDVTDDTTFEEGDTVYAVFDVEPDALNSAYYVIDSTRGIGKIIDGSESDGVIRIWYKDTVGEETIEKIPRTSFNRPVYIGNKVTSISPNFLRGCTSFNQPITIPTNVTTIGSGFLYGCTSYNKAIDVPSTVAMIGKCFMYYCHNMTSQVTLHEGLYFIDDYFMFACDQYEKQLNIPSTVVVINNSFMENCKKFNNNNQQTTSYDYSIPTGIWYIGESFLANCPSFRGNLDMSGCTSNYFTTINGSLLYSSTGYSGTVTFPAQITEIGSNVLGWLSPNRETLSLTLPNFSDADFALENLEIIGDGFLNQSKYTGTMLLSGFTSLKSIGSNFLRNASTFNNGGNALSLPTSLVGTETRKAIGRAFLYGCQTFAVPLIINAPVGVDEIDTEFLYLAPAESITFNNFTDKDVASMFVEDTVEGEEQWRSFITYSNPLLIIGLTENQFNALSTKFPNNVAGRNLERAS